MQIEYLSHSMQIEYLSHSMQIVYCHQLYTFNAIQFLPALHKYLGLFLFLIFLD